MSFFLLIESLFATDSKKKYKHGLEYQKINLFLYPKENTMVKSSHILRSAICVVSFIWSMGFSMDAHSQVIPDSLNPTQRQALQDLFPEADRYEEGVAGENKYYRAFTQDRLMGVGVLTFNYGYYDDIEAMVGISAEGVSKGLMVTRQDDDPKRWRLLLNDRDFFSDMVGVDINRILLTPRYDKSCEIRCAKMFKALSVYDIDGVSGATYTANAVVKDLLDAFYVFDQVR